MTGPLAHVVFLWGMNPFIPLSLFMKHSASLHTERHDCKRASVRVSHLLRSYWNEALAYSNTRLTLHLWACHELGFSNDRTESVHSPMSRCQMFHNCQQINGDIISLHFKFQVKTFRAERQRTRFCWLLRHCARLQSGTLGSYVHPAKQEADHLRVFMRSTLFQFCWLGLLPVQLIAHFHAPKSTSRLPF